MTAATPFHHARIIGKQLASPTIALLTLKVPTLTTFSAGQLVDFVSVPQQSWVGGFSLLSSSDNLPLIDLAVKKTKAAPALWVHHVSRVGDAVQVRVGGTCTLDTTTKHCSTTFLAGGIGISPMLSLYRQHVFERQQHKHNEATTTTQTKFIYSASTQEELVFRDQLTDLSRVFQDTMVFSLTQQKEWNHDEQASDDGPSWILHETGRVVIPRLLLPTTEPPLDCTSLFYLCGPPSMMDDAVRVLSKAGVEKSRIRYEKWW